MKKKIITCLSSLLLISGLVACNGNKPTSKDEEDSSSKITENVTTENVTENVTTENLTTTEDKETQSDEGNKQTSSENNNQTSSTPNFNEMTYAQKIDAYLDGANILDNNFVQKIKDLGPYDVNEAVTNNAIYASPNGNGDGTFDSPYNLQDAIDEVKPGQTIYLKAGTYDAKQADGYYINCKGNANNYITIRPYQNDKVIVTNSTTSGSDTFGFSLDGGSCYIIIEGIEFCNMKNKAAAGVVAWGNDQNHYIIRDCEFHHIEARTNDNDANAILLFGQEAKPISNVAIINNYAHNNVNGWSENISTSGNCEAVYVFENRVDNNTNIGIDFYGNAKYCSNPELDQPRYCVAANNTITNISCSYADCAGLYVDGARDIILQYNTVKNSQYGIEVGSEEKQGNNYPVKNIIVRNNICENNEITGIRIGGYETSRGLVKDTKVINNTFINNSTKDNGAELIFAKVDNIEITNNIFLKKTSGELFSADFNETYTKNLHFTNNLVYQTNKNASDVGFNIYSYFEGIDAFNAKYNNGLIFETLEFNEDYTLTNSLLAKDKGFADIDVGNYDYRLNRRVNGTVDIGAIEY